MDAQFYPAPNPIQAIRPVPYAFPAAQGSPLDQDISTLQSTGWAVESRSTHQATVVSGAPVNHILHLLLTLFTCGLWSVVWMAVSMFGGQKRIYLRMDEYGRVYRNGSLVNP